MTFEDELKAALSNIAATARMAQIPSQQPKIYELWILFKLVESLRNDGWPVQLRGHDDVPVNQFIERGAPGYIHPQAARPPKPSFVLLTRPRDGAQFELHNSVRFVGRSGALHEFDVCLIARAIGNSLRSANQKRAAVGHPMLSVECKHYSGTAGIDVPRAAIGILYDATHWQRAALRDQQVAEGVAVMPHLSLAERLDRTFATVIAQRGFTLGAQRLADEYNLRLYPKMKVGSTALKTFLNDAKSWLRAYAG
jgi:hypothetical protein